MLIENLFPQSVFGKGFHCCRPNGLEDWNLFVLFRYPLDKSADIFCGKVP